MRKILSLLFLFSPLFFWGQQISQVKSTVAFFYAKNDSGQLVPNGTGFFVGVEDSSKTKFTTYIVTAKHVIQKQSRQLLPELFIRLNTLDSSSRVVLLNINSTGKNKNVFIHPDSTVDIAVIPFLPNDQIFDFLVLPQSFLTSKADFKELKIQEGTEVFFTGLFAPFTGEKRNYPVVRFGKVALVTNEKIPWDGNKTELYLVESASYGGNSGSPVFFYMGADRGDGALHVGAPILKLAGIMKGFFGQNTPIKMINTNAIPVSVSNIGIAAVTPSYLLQEILYSDELRKLRGY